MGELQSMARDEDLKIFQGRLEEKKENLKCSGASGRFTAVYKMVD